MSQSKWGFSDANAEKKSPNSFERGSFLTQNLFIDNTCCSILVNQSWLDLTIKEIIFKDLSPIHIRIKLIIFFNSKCSV